MTETIPEVWGKINKEGAFAVCSPSPYETTGTIVDSSTPTTDAPINIKTSAHEASNSTIVDATTLDNIRNPNQFHYDNIEYRSKMCAELEHVASYKYTQHALETLLTSPSYKMLDLDGIVKAGTSQQSFQGVLSQIPKKQYVAVELRYTAASMADINNQNTSYGYSYINHEGSGEHISDFLATGRLSMMADEHEASRGYTDTERTSSTDIVQTYSASESNFGIEPATPPFIVPFITEHVLPKPQLDAWLAQFSNASMPLSERLEKNKVA